MDGWMDDGEGKREMHRYVIKQNEMLIVEPQWQVCENSHAILFKIFYIFEIFHNKMFWGKKANKSSSTQSGLISLLLKDH